MLCMTYCACWQRHQSRPDSHLPWQGVGAANSECWSDTDGGGGLSGGAIAGIVIGCVAGVLLLMALLAFLLKRRSKR
jgi:hypothetical protein